MNLVSNFAKFLFFAVLFLIPVSADAAITQKTFEVSGWIPYWRTATGTIDTLPNLDTLTEINPFGYTLKNDGTLNDTAELGNEPWLSFIAAAREKKVRVIPTVMSSNRALMEQILNDGPRRRALADEITRAVKENNFDGIDIDFENKSAETRVGYSTFLQALRLRMPEKFISCTIESRTPFEDRYYGIEIPADAGIFANDLKEINKYCDRVKIMAYDQQGIDLKLAATAASSSQLYAPVGDPAWVEKVVNLMMKDIDKRKIMIGVPTYGYEYDVTVYSGPEYVYDILWTFNPGYATPIAQQNGITPMRNSAGEMHFTYTPPGVPSSTPPTTMGINANLAAAAATQIAQANNTNLTFRMLNWPDAESVRQKVELAKRLGVRGVAVFKFDGGQDPAIWNTLRTYATAPAIPPTPTASLTRALKIGQTGADVKTLQIVLNSDSATQIASTGAGSPGFETTKFGTLTLRALEKFQIKHGIAKKGDSGFGTLGPRTRAQLNLMLGR